LRFWRCSTTTLTLRPAWQRTGLEGPLIGLAFDGTGFGTDGCIWGGEILLAGLDQFERAGHLAYVPMPGGNAAIKAPWRMAISYLYRAYGRDLLLLDLPAIKKVPGPQN
jgi:hydrogenase maturation protein HypF